MLNLGFRIFYFFFKSLFLSLLSVVDELSTKDISLLPFVIAAAERHPARGAGRDERM